MLSEVLRYISLVGSLQSLVVLQYLTEGINLVPVVGGSSLVGQVGVVNAAGVEPLELPVFIVAVQLSSVLLLPPVDVSCLAGKSKQINEN